MENGAGGTLNGLPEFSAIKAEHVEPAVMRVLDENRSKVEALLEDTEQGAIDFEKGILPLEELGDRLHHVWAPVSHLHAVKNSPELREAYNKCLPALSRYQTDLAQNERLFRLYENIANKSTDPGKEGAKSLLQHAIRDFKLSGVNLPAEAKARFKAIMEELSQLQARFEQNVLDSMAAWSHHISQPEQLAGLPGAIRDAAEQNAADAKVEGWLLRLDQPTYMAVITHAENRDLRYQFYKAWVTRASDQGGADAEFDNTEIIDKVLQLRHEAARLVDFDNFAEYSLATKMAGSVGEVQDFLQQLAEHSRNCAAGELEELERFAGRALAAWDIAFFSEKLRQDRYSVSDDELRPYFPVDKVLAGLFAVVERLYGIRAVVDSEVDTWVPDVRFYRFEATNAEPVGGVFVDLFARPNKRSGAWMDECITRKDFNGAPQKPVAHLVCNFTPPTRNQPCLLTHDDVLTLFHEFGHTLHHLLTRIGYPSVSGINGVPWDAVELPSQFMENYAWEPEVVAMISGHYRTNEPLPTELLAKLQASRVFQAGMQMVRQLEFALFDLRLHAEFDASRGARVMPLLEQIRRQVAVVRQPEFNRFPHAFSHVFGGGYAAGYYSYKWAEVLAADAWSAFTASGIFDAETATKFRTTILEIGGSREISEAFRAFRGRDPDIQPLLRQTGIVSTR